MIMQSLKLPKQIIWWKGALNITFWRTQQPPPSSLRRVFLPCHLQSTRAEMDSSCTFLFLQSQLIGHPTQENQSRGWAGSIRPSPENLELG